MLALSRIPWKLVGIGLLVVAILVQTIRLERSERRADALQYRVKELNAALDEADRKSKESQGRSKTIIERVITPVGTRHIEKAPLPGNCRTPTQILEEPLL